MPEFPSNDRVSDSPDSTSSSGKTSAARFSKPLLDRERALRRMGGDTELLDGLMECFIEDAPDLIRQLDKALAAGDAAEVARFAHSLKGLAANFDAIACRDAAQLVEQIGFSNDLSNASPKIDQLKEQVTALLDALKSELE